MFVLVLGRSGSRLTPVQTTKVVERMFSGGYGGGDIPVPIPNTAVKPTCADGTWGSPPGRVGRRRDFLKSPHQLVGALRIAESNNTCRHAKLVAVFLTYFVASRNRSTALVVSSGRSC